MTHEDLARRIDDILRPFSTQTDSKSIALLWGTKDQVAEARTALLATFGEFSEAAKPAKSKLTTIRTLSKRTAWHRGYVSGYNEAIDDYSQRLHELMGEGDAAA